MPDLTKYFTNHRPFGPSSATPIRPDKLLGQHLYDADTPLHHQRATSTTFIIGRRGSGKTALLHTVALSSKFSIVVELQTPHFFEDIVRTVDLLAQPPLLVEPVAALWDALLWAPLLWELYAQHSTSSDDDMILIKSYLDGAGVFDRVSSSAAPTYYAVMTAFLDAFEEQFPATRSLRRVLNSKLFNQISIHDAKDAAIRYMAKHRISAVILLDSLEKFRLKLPIMIQALEGFLKCLGEWSQPDSPVSIRCCLPAELYHQFRKISSNPNKDFSDRVQLLHWDPMALLKIGALRYSIYLNVYKPQIAKTLDRWKSDEDISIYN